MQGAMPTPLGPCRSPGHGGAICRLPLASLIPCFRLTSRCTSQQSSSRHWRASALLHYRSMTRPLQLYPPSPSCKSNALVRAPARVVSTTCGRAASCLCADPCAHSVQDLNRLTCFRDFWNRGIGQFLFLVVHERQVFVVWGCGWYCWDTDCCPAHPSCPPDDLPMLWCIQDAAVTAFLERVRANGEVSVSVSLWDFSVALAGGEGGKIARVQRVRPSGPQACPRLRLHCLPRCCLGPPATSKRPMSHRRW